MMRVPEAAHNTAFVAVNISGVAHTTNAGDGLGRCDHSGAGPRRPTTRRLSP